MEDILRVFREATGHLYDGSMYDMDDLQANQADDGNESDIDVPIAEFSSSDSEEENDEERNESGASVSVVSDDGWSRTTSNVHVDPFEEECGPNHGLDASDEPYDYFSLIISEDFYVLACSETNDYAKWRQEKANTVDTVWYETTPAEMKLFMNINILMGIHRLPEYAMFWSSDDRLRVPGIADVMSKNRYEKLSKYFHLNNPRTQPPRGHRDFDPLYKIRPLIDMVQTNIAACLKPYANISFDEAMIAYHGKLSFKQYIKGKPNPWGIKVWCATDAATGYLLKFSFYAGKVTEPMPHGSGYHTIKNLGEPFLHKNHHFVFDNYFSSIKLAEDLLRVVRDKTYTCSTVRSSRKGWPKVFSAQAGKKMKKGDVHFRQRGNLVSLAWKDKRFVTMLSTNTTPGMTTVRGGYANVEVPTLVDVYNRSMGGVDRFDQLSSYYPVGRKCRKWWRYVFCFLLQTAIINSWIISSVSHRPKPKAKQISQLDFRLSLCTSLVVGNVTRKRKGPTQAPSTAGVGTADLREHRLISMTGNRRACYWCSKSWNYDTHGRVHETVFGCSLCQVHLGKGECFSKYHDSLKH